MKKLDRVLTLADVNLYFLLYALSTHWAQTTYLIYASTANYQVATWFKDNVSLLMNAYCALGEVRRR